MSFNGDINDLIIPAWIEQSKSVEELFSKIILTLPHNTVNSVLTVYSWQGISMKI
jgi:hypothetical protein